MNVLRFNGYSCQVELINAAIDKAKIGSYLPHVADPSQEIQEVLIACVEWNMVYTQQYYVLLCTSMY